MSDATVIMRGDEELLTVFASLERNLQSGGSFSQGIWAGGRAAAMYAGGHSPVLTGTLRDSHTVEEDGLLAHVYIDPGARSPKGGRPAIYGPIVAERGRDFYRETVTSDGAEVAQKATETFVANTEGLK